MGVKSRTNFPVLITICKQCKKLGKHCICKTTKMKKHEKANTSKEN